MDKAIAIPYHVKMDWKNTRANSAGGVNWLIFIKGNDALLRKLIHCHITRSVSYLSRQWSLTKFITSNEAKLVL